MISTRRCIAFPALMMVALLAPAASGQTDLSKFPLIKAIPADAFISVAARTNPEQKFLEEHWSKVWEAFEDSGIMSDVWDIVSENMDDDALDKVEELQKKFGKLFEAVEWSGLFEHEFVYFGRFPSKGGYFTYEGAVLGRMDKDKAEANHKALRALVDAIVKLIKEESSDESVTTRDWKIGDASILTISSPGMEQVNIGFHLAAIKDKLLIAFGSDAVVRDPVGLLQGKSEDKGVASSDKFKRAFDGLPPAEDVVVFFDTSRMFEGIHSIMKVAMGESAKKEPAKKAAEDEEEGENEPDEPTEQEVALKIVGRLISDLNMFDYVATVGWTDGFRVYTESVTALKPSAKESPLYTVFASGKPISNFAQFIPKGAKDFSVGSGISFLELYRYIIAFVETNIPDGKENVKEFKERLKEELEIDIEKEVIGLIEGTSVSVGMGEDWVLMLRVTDEKLATKQITRLVNFVKESVPKELQISITPAKVKGSKEEFRQIASPMMMMMGAGVKPPVFGCREGFFILGTSADAVTRVLDTADGTKPSILESKRFKAEALFPKEGTPVDSISFSDETKLGEELQQAFGGLAMLPMMMGMAQGLPKEVSSIVQKAGPILSKLGTVLGKLDFYQSSSSYTTFDGKQWRTKDVQNYKTPKPPKKENGDDEDDDE